MRTLFTQKHFTILSILAVILFSCTKDEKNQTSFLNPPLEDLDPEFVAFEPDVLNGDTLIVESGTKIIIPENAFYDSSGNFYSGKTTVNYREFNHALDIYLAGIPMEFYTMGQRKQMQTAGMFEIRAYDSIGNTLYLNDKPIEIRYASKVEGNDYNFFGFNEETGNWEFLDYPENENNPEVNALKEKIEQLKPKRKFPFTKEFFVFNYSAIADVHYNLDFSNIRKWINEGREEILPASTKAKKYGLTWSGLHGKTSVNYYGKYQHAAMMIWKHISGDPITPAIDFPYKSTELQHVNGNFYQLNIYDNTEDTNYNNDNPPSPKYTMLIECIMPLQSLYKFPPEYWQSNYDEAIRKVQEYESLFADMTRVFRSTEIYQLGVYNFDLLMKDDNNFFVQANFVLNTDNKKVYTNSVKCMPQDERSLISLNSGKNIWLAPADTNYRIFTLTNDLKIAIFPIEEYKNLNFDSLKTLTDKKYDFTLEVIDREIKTRKDIEEILNIKK